MRGLTHGYFLLKLADIFFTAIAIAVSPNLARLEHARAAVLLELAGQQVVRQSVECGRSLALIRLDGLILPRAPISNLGEIDPFAVATLSGDKPTNSRLAPGEGRCVRRADRAAASGAAPGGSFHRFTLREKNETNDPRSTQGVLLGFRRFAETNKNRCAPIGSSTAAAFRIDLAPRDERSGFVAFLFRLLTARQPFSRRPRLTA